MDIEVREPKTEVEFALYYDLRWRILREPWTTNRETGKDDHEREAIHMAAWAGDKLVGVGRVHFNSAEEAQVRYMAVETGFSGRGIGSLILKSLEERVRRAGVKSIILRARDTAIEFYRNHDYIPTGQSSTLFNSIAHSWMRKEL